MYKNIRIYYKKRREKKKRKKRKKISVHYQFDYLLLYRNQEKTWEKIFPCAAIHLTPRLTLQLGPLPQFRALGNEGWQPHRSSGRVVPLTHVSWRKF